MKKQYTTPEMRVIEVNQSEIICTSTSVTFYNSSEDEYETEDMY